MILVERARCEWTCMHKCGDRFIVVLDLANNDPVADSALSYWAWEIQRQHSCLVDTKP